MPLRVLRLIPLPTIREQTWTHSFASSLQVAAGRAWARRVTAYAPSKSPRNRGIRAAAEGQVAFYSSRKGDDSATSRGNGHLLKPKTSVPHSGISLNRHIKRYPDADKPTRPYNRRDRLQNDRPIHETKGKVVSGRPHRIGKHAQGIAATHFDLTMNIHEPPDAETCSPDYHNIDLFNEISPESKAELLPVVSDSLPSPGSFLLHTPSSRASFYHNLLYLIGARNLLPPLVDYHRRYPSWQSTRSYNVLIDLSIRHRQLGITGHLFRSLKRNGLSMNMESHKLMVRCLVQQGMWEDAWDYVWSLIKKNSLPRDAKGCEAIPFSIWLELCRAPKKRRKPFRSEGSTITLEEQYQFLHNVTPGKIPSLRATSPFAIFCLVDLMLRTGRQEPAVTLTKAYFKELPPFLNKKVVQGCLRIVHCHMARSTAKPGLPKFFDVRRTLISFLQLHPSLKPNGRTLCLLFKSLQRARKCGSIAWTQLAKFKKGWGPQVENRRVLRRVSQLALKEGRLDITKRIHKLDFCLRVRRRRRLREESLVGRLGRGRRQPYRLIYPQNGKEARLWYRHRARTRLKRWRVSWKGLVRAPPQACVRVTLDPDLETRLLRKFRTSPRTVAHLAPNEVHVPVCKENQRIRCGPERFTESIVLHCNYRFRDI